MTRHPLEGFGAQLNTNLFITSGATAGEPRPLTAQDVTTWIKTREATRAPTNLRLLGEARGSVGAP